MSEYFDPFKEYDKKRAEKKSRMAEKKIEGDAERNGSAIEKSQVSVAKPEEFQNEHNETLKSKQKNKKSRGSVYVLIFILCLVLPLFLLGNLFISNYLFALKTAEFEKAMQEKVNELENSFYDQITYSADLVSYYVANECMSEVMEIKAYSEQTGASQGTGFIISADGYVLTNAHVATYYRSYGNGKYGYTAAEKILLYFADSNTAYEAECLGFDNDYDLALLKLKNPPQGLNYAEFANSVEVAYGEPCVAIGNAKSKGLSVTDGVVSNPMVNINFTTTFVTASIQHSAPINNGNSGGPLYNMFGQVIGVNTFKLDSSDTTEGMAYAMPSVIIKDWVNSLEIEGLKIAFVETPKIGGESLKID